MKKKKFWQKKSFWVIIVVVLLIVVGISALTKKAKKNIQAAIGDTVQSTEVTKGDICNTIDGNGSLAVADEVNVMIPNGVKVEEVCVEAGDVVAEGDVLAKLDSSSVKRVLINAEDSIDTINDAIDDNDDLSDLEIEELKEEVAKLEEVKTSLTALKNDPEIKATAAGIIGTVAVTDGTEVQSSSSSGSIDTSSYQSIMSSLSGMSFEGTADPENVTEMNLIYDTSEVMPGGQRLFIVYDDDEKMQTMSETSESNVEAMSEDDASSESGSTGNAGESASATKLIPADEAPYIDEPEVGKSAASCTIYSSDYYTSEIVWSEVSGDENLTVDNFADNYVAVSTFEGNKCYQAIVQLNAKDGYSFCRNDSDIDTYKDFLENADAYSYTPAAANEVDGVTAIRYTTSIYILSGSDDSDDSDIDLSDETQKAIQDAASQAADSISNAASQIGDAANQAAGTVSQAAGTLSGLAGSVSSLTDSSSSLSSLAGLSSSSLSGLSSLSSLSGLSSSSLSSLTGSSSGAPTGESENYYETVAFTIQKQENVKVDINVDELDILKVQVGQTADITLDAIEDQTFEGTITKVAQTSDSTSGNAKYQVEITIPMDSNMRFGMSATASILAEEKDDVLMIPMNALQQKGDQTFVYTENDGKGNLSGEKVVTTGLSDGTNVEITDGLAEGDTVYYTRSENSDMSFLTGSMSESETEEAE